MSGAPGALSETSSFQGGLEPERLRALPPYPLDPGYAGLGEAGEGFLRAALTLPADGYDDAAERIARAL